MLTACEHTDQGTAKQSGLTDVIQGKSWIRDREAPTVGWEHVLETGITIHRDLHSRGISILGVGGRVTSNAISHENPMVLVFSPHCNTGQRKDSGSPSAPHTPGLGSHRHGALWCHSWHNVPFCHSGQAGPDAKMQNCLGDSLSTAQQQVMNQPAQ